MTISDSKIRARQEFARPPKSEWEALVGAATSSLSDGIGRMGAFDGGIRPVTRNTVFAGPALTVKCRSGDNLAALVSLEWTKPGDVVVLANDGATVAALAGGNYVAMLKARGAVALICDGPARDLDELDEIGLPVFARGVTPAGPFKTGPGTIGFPVAVGPVVVSSGDIVVGDRDGLVVVAQSDIELAVKGYQMVREREAEMAAAIAEGGIPGWLRSRIAAVEVDVE